MIDGDQLLRTIREGEPDDEIWEEASHQIVYGFERKPADTFDLLARALAVARHADSVAALAHHFLEYLLETDFAQFGAVERAIAAGNGKLLFALLLCTKYGEAQEGDNAARWDALLRARAADLNAFRASGVLAGLDAPLRVKRFRPVYRGGEAIHASDRLLYNRTVEAVVAAVFQTREFTPLAPVADWRRYREGILIKLAGDRANALNWIKIDSTETDEDVELVARAG